MENIHFIGIGGISMSGIAELMLSKGYKVSGSDAHPSEITERLTELGAKIGYPQKADNIPEDTDLVVMTAAIHEDNPELMEAKRRGLKIETRADYLGNIMKAYDTPISIAGTHGKTTTTAMVSEILMSAGGDPTISIGGVLKDIGGNFRIGADKYFVMEACEYTNSYHSFYPRIGVILNVEADHLDFFKDIDDIRKSFNRFAQNIPDDGVLVINADIEGYEEVVKGLKCRIVTFGKKPTADWHPLNLSCDDFGRYSFETEHNGKKNSFKLGVYGTHNVLNALAAIAVANELGIGYEAVEKGLRSFTGTDRRFEIKGELNGFTIIDDYAHHPTEIAATIEAAKKYPHRDLWIIFQSHTYTRTKALMDDFADVLSKADHVISAEIYPARETDNLGISGKTLADEIRKRGTDCYYFPTFEEIKKFVRETLIDKDLLITMGAGDVVKIADELLSET